MFVHINDKDVIDLKTNGKLSCLPSGNSHPHIRANEFEITYKRRHPASLNTKIFDCFIMETTLTLALRKIKLSPAAMAMPEGLRYFYLDWFVRDLYNNLIQRGKKRMVVYTTLPHITEIMVDQGFQEIGITRVGETRGTKDSRKTITWTK